MIVHDLLMIALEQMVEIEAVRQQYKKEIARLIEYNQQLQNGVVAEFDQRQLAQRQLEVIIVHGSHVTRTLLTHVFRWPAGASLQATRLLGLPGRRTLLLRFTRR